MVRASGKYCHFVQEKQVDNAPIIQVEKRKQRQVEKQVADFPAKTALN